MGLKCTGNYSKTDLDLPNQYTAHFTSSEWYRMPNDMVGTVCTNARQVHFSLMNWHLDHDRVEYNSVSVSGRDSGSRKLTSGPEKRSPHNLFAITVTVGHY